MDYDFKYQRIGSVCCGCSVCFKILNPDDLVATCPDCGAIVCKECCEAGKFDEHECDPEDDYDDNDIF